MLGAATRHPPPATAEAHVVRLAATYAHVNDGNNQPWGVYTSGELNRACVESA